MDSRKGVKEMRSKELVEIRSSSSPQKATSNFSRMSSSSKSTSTFQISSIATLSKKYHKNHFPHHSS
ncbi:hypothetical protein KSS87_008405 [Heliosperma pusillum]|nr:hypothetical protein KSS87_008405 [Heliosperma pusillum]